MNRLTVIVLVVCVAFSAAQNSGVQPPQGPQSTSSAGPEGTAPSGGAAGSGVGSLTPPFPSGSGVGSLTPPFPSGSSGVGSLTPPFPSGSSGVGSLTPPFPSGGFLTPTLPTGGPLDNFSNPRRTTNNNAGGSTKTSSLFRNPLMSLGMMGGDNMGRAMMVPFLSRFGNTASYYWLRGGTDKFFPVLMSDMMNRLLGKTTGMNPAMSAFFTGQMFDAPDNYAFSNMLFNGLGRSNSGASQNQRGLSPLPTGAASPFRSNSNMFRGNNLMNPLLATMMLM